ncbi:hypothetical protein GBA52_008060 [Prunus armeniaca]|nr:hypothetical protein GBA52_008060 [Prunus armeniaca]
MLLDELQLDLYHAEGGHIGNSYSFLFNTKMHEGSFLYAKAIDDKLIEVLDNMQQFHLPVVIREA